jgi:hypothetical protein
MALKKDYFENCKWDSPILYVITAEMVQDIVEPNIGRRLTDVEIERMHYAMLDNTEAYYGLMNFIISSAEQSIDNTGNQWSSVDKDFQDRKPTFVENGYQLGL